MAKRVFPLVCFLFLFCFVANAEESFPYLGNITADLVHIRAGQSTAFESLGQLDTGEKVVVVGKKYSWYKIKLPLRAQCYISVKFIQKRGDNIGSVTGNPVNLRAGPGEDFAIIGKLPRETLVRLKGKTESWYRIEPVEGSFGWVSAQFVAYESKNVPSPRIVADPTRNIYKQKQIQKVLEPVKKVKEKAGPKQKDGIISVVGRLEDLGRIYLGYKDIRHKLVVDGKIVYLLEGNHVILDSMVTQRVNIIGKIKDYPRDPFQYPVLLIKKINFVL